MSCRYPLQALVDASGLSEHALSQRVGLTGTPLIRARRNGLIESAADKYACRLGLVPWLVWSDWLEDAAVECAERSCSERFVPYRKSQRFCSRACQQREQKREWYRRRYASDPEFRSRENARSQSYREECAPLLNRQQAERYQQNREVRQAWNEEYRARNRERIAARGRAYYIANRERIIARQREYDQRRRAQRRSKAA